MARISDDNAQVNARILYWGIEDAGKLTSLAVVQAKLRADHRGTLREIPTRLDPSVSYTVLPISLGEIGGMQTQIELVCVPGAPEQAPTRKQLLDEVDGIVLVVDCQEQRMEENASLLDELRKGLDDYARDLNEIPLVVQYNKRDLADDYAIDEMHRRFALGDASVFESVATEGTGVLQALATISKKVMRSLRGESLGAARSAPTPEPAEPIVPTTPDVDEHLAEDLHESDHDLAQEPVLKEFDVAPSIDLDPQDPDAPLLAGDALEPLDGTHPGPALEVSTLDLEEAIMAESEEDQLDADVHSAQHVLEPPWRHGTDSLEPPLGARINGDLTIVSVGEATRASDRSVRVPLVLGDRDGETSTVVLTLSIDPLVDQTD